MFLSAAIFGFFGFYFLSFNYYASDGTFLFFVALFDWTIKGAAVAFLISALLTMIAFVVGCMMYALAGMLTAISLVIVAALDFADPDHTVFHPVLVLILAAWIGFTAWAMFRETRAVLALRRHKGSGAGA